MASGEDTFDSLFASAHCPRYCAASVCLFVCLHLSTSSNVSMYLSIYPCVLPLHVPFLCCVLPGTAVVLLQNFPAYDILIFSVDGFVNLLEISKSPFVTHCDKLETLATVEQNSDMSPLGEAMNRCGLAPSAGASLKELPPKVRYFYLTTDRSASYVPRTKQLPRFYGSVLYVNRSGFVSAFGCRMPEGMRALLRSDEDF